jgi:hypothetical protein
VVDTHDIHTRDNSKIILTASSFVTEDLFLAGGFGLD